MQAVSHLHSSGVIHGALTPEKILISEAGQPVVVNFEHSIDAELAVQLQSSSATLTTSTTSTTSTTNTTNTKFGSSEDSKLPLSIDSKYISPEVKIHNSPRTIASELYGVGKIISEILDAWTKRSNQSAPTSLTTIYQRLMSENPVNRPSAALLIDELQSEDESKLIHVESVAFQSSEERMKIIRAQIREQRRSRPFGSASQLSINIQRQKMELKLMQDADGVRLISPTSSSGLIRDDAASISTDVETMSSATTSNRMWFDVSEALDLILAVTTTTTTNTNTNTTTTTTTTTSQGDLRSQFRVTFLGEPAADQGGLTREFYHNLYERIFLEQKLIATADPRDSTLRTFLPVSGANLKHLEVVGQLLIKALFEDISLQVFGSFPPFFYRLLMRSAVELVNPTDQQRSANLQLVTMRDYEQFMGAQSYLQLQQLLIVDDATLVSYQLTFEDLKENGEKVMVNTKNCREYVQRKVYHDLIGTRARELQAIWKGFHHVSFVETHKFLMSLQSDELCLLLSGDQHIDIPKLFKHHAIRFIDFPEHSSLPSLIEQALSNLTNLEFRKFLRFVVATDSLPVPLPVYSSNNTSSSGSGYILICFRNNMNLDSLPQSHTCSRQIDFPPILNATMEKVKFKILQAIDYAGDSFGFR